MQIILLKVLYFFWGLIGLVMHVFLVAEKPTLPAVIAHYKSNQRPLVQSLFGYIIIYGIWAGMSRWAVVLNMPQLETYSNVWLGAWSPVFGYASDSFFPKIIALVSGLWNRLFPSKKEVE